MAQGRAWLRKSKKIGSKRRDGSALIAMLIILVAVSLFVAGLSMMQAYFLRTLANRGSESQTRSASEGVARIMVERLVSQSAISLGVVDSAMVAQLNADLTSSGVLDSLQISMGTLASIDRDSTRYILEFSNPVATAVANKPITAEGRTLQVTSDMPRRGFRVGPEPTGMLGAITGRIQVKALIRSVRRGATTTVARVLVYKIPPWQHALYADSSADFIISAGSQAVVNGTIWADNELKLSGSGSFTLAGNLQATQGLSLASGTTANVVVLPEAGGVVGETESLIPLSRDNVEAGYVSGTEIGYIQGQGQAQGRAIGPVDLLETYQGRVRIGGAFALPLVRTRGQSYDRAGRGECEDMKLNYPYTAPQWPDSIACNNGAGFYPMAQIKAGRVDTAQVDTASTTNWITLGAGAPANYVATLRSAMVYWKYFPGDGSINDLAGQDTIAYEGNGWRITNGGIDPSNATHVTHMQNGRVRIWRGIFPDPRNDTLRVKTVLRYNAGVLENTTMKTWRGASNNFGYIVNLSTAGLIPATNGAFLSFKRTAQMDPTDANYRSGLRAGQEVVVLHSGGCLAGPLTIASELPVFIIPEVINGFNGCAGYQPVLIDAPSIALLPPQAVYQAIARNDTTLARWDAPAAGTPIPLVSYGNPSNGTVKVNGVFRARFRSGTNWNGLWEQIPAVIGDWSRVSLIMKGMIDARQDTLLLIRRSNAGANSLRDSSVLQPRLRALAYDTLFRRPSFQPPGSWQSTNIPSGGAWPGATRTVARQQNAWWGGFSIARLMGGFVTMPGVR